jgi:hypothetical protein
VALILADKGELSKVRHVGRELQGNVGGIYRRYDPRPLLIAVIGSLSM